jgi:hypothetical protein
MKACTASNSTKLMDGKKGLKGYEGRLSVVKWKTRRKESGMVWHGTDAVKGG